MKRKMTSLGLTLGWVVLLATQHGGAPVQSNQEKELLDVENRITAEYLGKNLDAFSHGADEDLSGFHASNPYRMDGRQKIQDALKTFYKYSSPTGLYKLQPRVQIYGDTAIVTYHYVETGEAEGGKLYAYDGKQTDVFVKKQGRWSLVHFHSSRVVKPQ
jgi:ketosteroid isomerase-like protein